MTAPTNGSGGGDPLLLRMERQIADWREEEPVDDWWQYQRDFAEAHEQIKSLQELLGMVVSASDELPSDATPPAQVGAATDSGEGLASSACPVCGLDEPHQHNSLEAMELRGRRFPITNDEWLRYVGRTIDPAMVNELDMLHKKAVRLATRALQNGSEEA